ncbi:MAG: hypothetical protein ACYCUV_04015, partial [Phycisphaerae bacterium]
TAGWPQGTRIYSPIPANVDKKPPDENYYQHSLKFRERNCRFEVLTGYYRERRLVTNARKEALSRKGG